MFWKFCINARVLKTNTPGQYGVSLGLTASQLNSSVGWLQSSSRIFPPGASERSANTKGLPKLVLFADKTRLLLNVFTDIRSLGYQCAGVPIQNPFYSLNKEPSIVVLVSTSPVNVNRGCQRNLFQYHGVLL